MRWGKLPPYGLSTFGDWRAEEIPNYQGRPDLVGAVIVNNSFAIAEIVGAVRIDGQPHEVHQACVGLIVSAPALYVALKDLQAVRPSNWDDEEDPEQALAWRNADAALASVFK